MKKADTQLGLSTATTVRRQPLGYAGRNGSVRPCAIPAHPAFDRIDVLATNRGEPMT
jgi:hypothetical protein